MAKLQNSGLQSDQEQLMSDNSREHDPCEPDNTLYKNCLMGDGRQPTFAEKRKRLAAKKKRSKKTRGLGDIPSETEISTLIHYYQNGATSEAESLGKSMTSRYPNYSMGWELLGAIHQQSGKICEALIADKKAAQLSPKDPALYKTLGNTFLQLEMLDDAVKSYKICVKLDPKLSEVHYNLGTTLLKLNQPILAKSSLEQAVTLNPQYIEAHYNLGNTTKLLEQFENSEKSFRRAIQLDPNLAQAHNNLGNTLIEQGHLDEAETSLNTALALNPIDARAYHNLGLLSVIKKEHHKAKDYYQRALELNPQLVDVHFSLSLYQLALAKFSNGFSLYETRYDSALSTQIAIPPTTNIPQYQGNHLVHDLKDKHLLILPEQGIGDEVMFASVLPDLESLAAQSPSTRITIACDSRLLGLYERSFNFLNVIPKDQGNQYQYLTNDLDYWMFVGSLPRLYRNKIEDFNHYQPYLVVDPTLAKTWQERFSKLKHKMNIGISWVGGSKLKKKQDRSMSLEKMLPILSKANQSANIINLQYGDHSEEIEAFEQKTGITIHDWEDSDPIKDLENFSAQVKSLDLVVSVDNSTVHFSGALGTKTYVLLPFNQDWRWAEGTNESYWYPRIVTVFKQHKAGEWDEIVQKITHVLK